MGGRKTLLYQYKQIIRGTLFGAPFKEDSILFWGIKRVLLFWEIPISLTSYAGDSGRNQFPASQETFNAAEPGGDHFRQNFPVATQGLTRGTVDVVRIAAVAAATLGTTWALSLGGHRPHTTAILVRYMNHKPFYGSCRAQGTSRIFNTKVHELLLKVVDISAEDTDIVCAEQ